MQNIMAKNCSKCGEPKELTEFHRSSGAVDGIKNICKACTSEYNSTTYYWKKTDMEGYSELNYNRKKYLRDNYKHVSYEGFTSYIKRSCSYKLSELTKIELKQEIEFWLLIKKKKRGKAL